MLAQTRESSASVAKTRTGSAASFCSLPRPPALFQPWRTAIQALVRNPQLISGIVTGFLVLAATLVRGLWRIANPAGAPGGNKALGTAACTGFCTAASMFLIRGDDRMGLLDGSGAAVLLLPAHPSGGFVAPNFTGSMLCCRRGRNSLRQNVSKLLIAAIGPHVVKLSYPRSLLISYTVLLAMSSFHQLYELPRGKPVQCITRSCTQGALEFAFGRVHARQTIAYGDLGISETSLAVGKLGN